MTIDERLERLTERTDALTQTLELMAGIQRASEERYEKGYEEIRRTFLVVLDSIKRLKNIAVAHEQRLDDLEQH